MGRIKTGVIKRVKDKYTMFETALVILDGEPRMGGQMLVRKDKRDRYRFTPGIVTPLQLR